MDEFNSRRIGLLVAHSRYVQILASALFSDTLEGLLGGRMPVGRDTRVAFATKEHANLAVRLPSPGP